LAFFKFNITNWMFLQFISFNFCDKVLAFFKFNITNWILDIFFPGRTIWM